LANLPCSVLRLVNVTKCDEAPSLASEIFQFLQYYESHCYTPKETSNYLPARSTRYICDSNGISEFGMNGTVSTRQRNDILRSST
jgi:hypothetical protein